MPNVLDAPLVEALSSDDIVLTVQGELAERPDVFTLDIPMAPLPVQSVRVGKFGCYTAPKVRQWKKELAAYVKKHFKWKPYEGPLAYSAVYRFQRPKQIKKCFREAIDRGETFHMHRKGDLLDNLNKATIDAMADIVFTDDAHIVKCLGLEKVWANEASMTIRFENLEGKVNLLPDR